MMLCLLKVQGSLFIEKRFCSLSQFRTNSISHNPFQRGLTFGSSSILYVNPPIGIADSISNWWKMSKGNVIAPNNKPSQARGATLEPHEIKNFWPLGGFLGGCSSESMVYCNVIALISRVCFFTSLLKV